MYSYLITDPPAITGHPIYPIGPINMYTPKMYTGHFEPGYHTQTILITPGSLQVWEDISTLMHVFE